MSGKKKIILAALLICFFLSPRLLHLNHARQMQISRSLLEIEVTAKTVTSAAIANLESLGISIPDNIMTSYQDGLALIEEVSALIQEENYEKASIKAVEALHKFREILKTLQSILPETPTEAEILAEKIIALKDAIERTYEYLSRIEKSGNEAVPSAYKTASLKNLVNEAKSHLEQALKMLDKLDIDSASKEQVLL